MSDEQIKETIMDDQEVFKQLPQEVQDKINETMIQIQDPEQNKQMEEGFKAIFAACDKDGDGCLDLEEWKDMQEVVYQHQKQKYGGAVLQTQHNIIKKWNYFKEDGTNGITLQRLFEIHQKRMKFAEEMGLIKK